MYVLEFQISNANPKFGTRFWNLDSFGFARRYCWLRNPEWILSIFSILEFDHDIDQCVALSLGS